MPIPEVKKSHPIKYIVSHFIEYYAGLFEALYLTSYQLEPKINALYLTLSMLWPMMHKLLLNIRIQAWNKIFCFNMGKISFFSSNVFPWQSWLFMHIAPYSSLPFWWVLSVYTMRTQNAGVRFMSLINNSYGLGKTKYFETQTWKIHRYWETVWLTHHCCIIATEQ